MNKVENEQRAKLESINRMKIEQQSSLDFTKKPQGGSSKSADELLTSHASSPSPVQQGVAEKQNLSLEEKQRLAQAKAQESRMKKVGPLQPLAPPPAKSTSSVKSTPNKPKDLTASLNMMSSSKQPMTSSTMNVMTSKPNYNPNLNTSSAFKNLPSNSWSTQSGNMSPQRVTFSAPMSGMTSSMSGMTSSMSGITSSMGGMSMGGMTSHTNGFNSQNAAVPQKNTFSSFPYNNSSNMSPNMGRNNMMSLSSMTPQTRPQNGNLSSLDNLLAMPSHKGKPIMGNMMANTTPQNPMAPNMTRMNASTHNMTPQSSMMTQQPNTASFGTFQSNQAPTMNANANQTNNLSKQDLLDFLG